MRSGAAPRAYRRPLGRHVPQPELDDTPESAGSRFVFSSTVGELAQLLLGVGGECANARLHPRHADQLTKSTAASSAATRGSSRWPKTSNLRAPFRSSAQPAVTMEGQNCGIRSARTIEKSGLERSHQPFVRAGGVGIAADILQVHIQRAEGLRAVQVHQMPRLRASAAISRAGYRMPVVLVRCVIAITRVRGVMAFSMPRSAPPSCAREPARAGSSRRSRRAARAPSRNRCSKDGCGP